MLMGPTHVMRKGIAIAALSLSTMLCAAGYDDQYHVFDKPTSIAEFTLHDQVSQMFTRASLNGHWSLMFVGFTSCPDVCPITLMKLEGVRAELGQRFLPEKIPEIIFIAVDPQRDEAVLADYLAHFHPKNIGVTGELDQLGILVESLDGFFRAQKPKPGSAHYDVVHTAAISVVNPSGDLVAKINPPFDVYQMSEFLSSVIRGSKAHD